VARESTMLLGNQDAVQFVRIATGELSIPDTFLQRFLTDAVTSSGVTVFFCFFITYLHLQLTLTNYTEVINEG
jgi:hypothetical protein